MSGLRARGVDSIDYLRLDWFALAELPLTEARVTVRCGGQIARSRRSRIDGPSLGWKGISEFQLAGGTCAGRTPGPTLRTRMGRRPSEDGAVASPTAVTAQGDAQLPWSTIWSPMRLPALQSPPIEVPPQNASSSAEARCTVGTDSLASGVRPLSWTSVEPERRFELLTCALRVRCSTD